LPDSVHWTARRHGGDQHDPVLRDTTHVTRLRSDAQPIGTALPIGSLAHGTHAIFRCGNTPIPDALPADCPASGGPSREHNHRQIGGGPWDRHDRERRGFPSRNARPAARVVARAGIRGCGAARNVRAGTGRTGRRKGVSHRSTTVTHGQHRSLENLA
jgi:hypothetical protein